MKPVLKRKQKSKEYLKRKNRKKNTSGKQRSEDYLQRKRQRKNRSKNKSGRVLSKQYLERKRFKKNSRDRSDNRQSYIWKVYEYEDQIKKGPTELCHSCANLFFDKSISVYSKQGLVELLGSDLIEKVVQIEAVNIVQLCGTCCLYVMKGQIPKLCLVNGLRFPDIPPELRGLTTAEERLVSARLPFMQIKALGVDKQLGIKGNIVNIPIDIDKTIDLLPRTASQTETIELKLKRMKIHKSDYLREFIRPCVVYRAADYLVRQPLYIDEGVKLSIEWMSTQTNKTLAEVEQCEDAEFQPDIHDKTEDWVETNDEEVNPVGEQTLLKEGLILAPGEGERPMPLLMDKYAEELSFPTIYCGLGRNLNPMVKIRYSDIAKSELRRCDRRCCTNPKLFYMYRKKQAIALNDATNIYLRRRKELNNLSVSEVLDKVDQMLANDEAYRVLQDDRSSPAYWQKKMKELMAMIRQLGVPTFFLTLSAAETHWSELLVILSKVLENRNITPEEALALSYQQKCDLIRNDPATCSRYFDHRFRELFKLVQTKGGPFGDYPVLDWYYRIEFQHRGSLHVHCLLWLDGAPQYDPTSEESKKQCEHFVEKFISCQTQGDVEVEPLTRYQFHKHTKSCKRFKLDAAVCRFGIPVFPMSSTKILDPLNKEDLNEDELERIDYDLEAIETELKGIDQRLMKKEDIDINFTDFLSLVQMDAGRYELAIRSTLKRSQVFLKRDLKDIRINGFNAEILKRHRANIDLQFVLDPYACVHYILNYINKSNRGMSTLLKQVVEECKSGYMSHQQKLYRICSKFINCSEVSSQEAVYVILSMPLSVSSRSSVFINTGERESRIKVLKSEKELRSLDPDSTETTFLGLLEYYIDRPDELEDLCLADFSAKYTFSKTKKTKLIAGTVSDNEDIEKDVEISGSVLKLKSSKGYVQLRKRPKIIRYRKYQLEKDEKNFFREKVMLYLAWRNEDTDLLQVDCKAKFIANKQIIEQREQQYVYSPSTDYDSIRENIEKEMREELVGNDEEEDGLEEFAIYDLQRQETNFEDESKVTDRNNPKPGSFTSPTILTDDAYFTLLRSLNQKQRQYVLGTMNLVKTSDEPFHHYIGGGAGTGKSVLIRGLYQSLIRYLNFRFQEPEKIKVLLVGPTGKSAFNIGGLTIHSALGIPVSQNSSMPILSDDKKSTLRKNLWYLKVVIIDEISMVGSSTFRKISEQLKQIFGSKEAFGGRSIIAVGDFNQLRPVMDNYVFSHASNSDYSVLAGSCLWRMFKSFRLTEIMRQKDDLVFAKALNNLSVGAVDEEDINLFESRLFPKNSTDIPENAIRLFPTNQQVECYNSSVIRKSQQIGYTAEARDFANGNCSRINKQALYLVSLLCTQKTYGLPKTIVLKTGIRYMITTNIDVSDGLVNDITGILRHVDIRLLDTVDVPQVLWFEFEEDRVGHIARSKTRPREYEAGFLTPIERVTRDIQTKTESKFVLVSRKQFPVVPAEAMTIHKSQGQTYDRVVVDMGRRLDLAKLYTSFSRARKSNGLFLLGTELKKINRRQDDHPISVELNRMNKESRLEFDLFDMNCFDQTSTKVFFKNLPYLSKHCDDIVADRNIIAADLLLLIETHSNDNRIAGYDLMAQIDCELKRPFGIGIYRRDTCAKPVVYLRSHVQVFEDKGHLEYLAVSFREVSYIVIYSSPKFPKIKTINLLEEISAEVLSLNTELVLIGDLNIEIQSNLGKTLIAGMANLGLQFRLEIGRPSNDFGNQIDIVFSTFPVLNTAYYDNLLSDHKAIFLVLK